MNNKYQLIYEGKAKKVFTYDDANKVIIKDLNFICIFSN